MLFVNKLAKIVDRNNSLVCVGLDADWQKIPELIKKNNSITQAIFSFNQQIVKATHDLVCAYKPNIAFYEAEGSQGLSALKKTIDFIKKNHPDIPVVLDAKIADIGNTNRAYIKMVFNYLNVDGLTLNPYLGQQALMPFLKMKNKFFFILGKTSNKGAGELQGLRVKGQPLYHYLAKQVVDKWNFNNNCGLVVGATYPAELKQVRKIVGNMLLLVPGIGQQGGDIRKTIIAGQDSNKQGLIINSSRSIIFASRDRDFAQTARKTTKKLKEKINNFRKGEND